MGGQAEIDRERQETDRLRRVLSEQTRRLEDVSAGFALALDELAAARATAEREQAEAARLREDLANVLGSASWRLTRPLRRLRSSTRPEDIAVPRADPRPVTPAAPAHPPPPRLDGAPRARRLDAGPRLGEHLPHLSSPDGLTTVYERKVDLVAGCAGATSLRDFGGIYAVHGRYLLEPAVRLGASSASMVDRSPAPGFEDAAAAARAQAPGLEVDLITADFRDPALFDTLPPVDVSILYEVLLHQENAVEVVRNVLRTTRRRVCFAEPCLREDVLSLPAAVLIQFLDRETKELLGHDSAWPESQYETDRFSPELWLWGHTTSHVIATFRGLGWELEDGEVWDNVCGEHWEYPLLRFRPADGD